MIEHVHSALREVIVYIITGLFSFLAYQSWRLAESVRDLNQNIAVVLERLAGHEKRLERHESRIERLEQPH